MKLSSKDYLVCSLNDNIAGLQKSIQSFENTKSEIVSSGLGQALKLTAASTWAAIVTAIKGIITKTSGSTTIAANKLGWDSTNNLWCYIPANGYYTTGHWLKMLNADVANEVGLTAAKLVKGNTILGISGTDAGYTAGVAAGKSSLIDGLSFTSFYGQKSTNSYVLTVTVPAGKNRMFLCLSWFIESTSGTSFSISGASLIKNYSTNNSGNAGYHQQVALYNVSPGAKITITISVPTTHRTSVMGGALFMAA